MNRNLMKRLLLVAVVFMWGLVAESASDCPNFLDLVGTGYHTNNWYGMSLTVDSDGKYLQFNANEKFLLSPRYPAPIRKIVLNVGASADSPKRTMRIHPLFSGAEDTTEKPEWAIDGLVKNVFKPFVFDFHPSENVDAVRICIDGSSGSIYVNGILILYGDKEAGEDELLRQFAQQLPVPENLRASSFTSTSLTVAADAVGGGGVSGYRFVVDKLEGMPRTERRENFVSAPALSSGWTYGETNGVTLGQYVGTSSSSYPDNKTASDGGVALKIVPDGKDDALVEILSPFVAENITECSFVCKASSNGSSDQVRVFGRTGTDAAWAEIGVATAVSSSKAYVTNAVPFADGIRQVKFEFAATLGSTANCGLDTLRIVYGGNETRMRVWEDEEPRTVPICELKNLAANARYAFRAQAVADPLADSPCRDSSWTEEQVVDLSWATITVTPPADVDWESNGGKMTVRWTAVEGADHYLVTVAPTDDPDHPVVENAKATGTSLVVTIPAAGEYGVTVTAVSPGGLSVATAEAVIGEVGVGALASVTLKAVDRQVIEASWSKVALAESYQAKLVKVGGTAETIEYGWPTDGNGRCVAPDGWTVSEGWNDPRCANTWTNGGVAYPALSYTGCALESDDRGQAITKVNCAYKCGNTSKSVLANTRLAVYATSFGGDWRLIEKVPVSGSLDSLKLSFKPEEDVRQIRLAAEKDLDFGSDANVRLGKLSIVYGEETRSEVESVRVTETKATFGNLDAKGKYVVTVVPQPSEGDALGATSPVVDLAAEIFRKTGAVPLSEVKDDLYVADFTGLATMTADFEARSVKLDYWQFGKGSGEPEKLLYTTGTNRTTGGVYAFCDKDRTPESFMLGTLATSTYGCSVGISFRNDTDGAFEVKSLAFDSVQRTFKSAKASYALEWLLTDGATGIDAEGEWQPLEIPETAPFVAGDSEATGEFRQSVAVTDGLPTRIPVGSVLILRWRHEKGASGPAMAIDNVKLEVSGRKKGFHFIAR